MPINTKVKDSSAKIIFKDAALCAQFLRGYVDVPLLRDVQPEDIEDVTERYIHMFTEERDSDIVKRVYLKEKKECGGDNAQENRTSFFVVSLIEHKSRVDYNVVMQILRYMVFIWEDYEKEAEKRRRGASKLKGFKYPPVLPIVFYDGAAEWTAAERLCDRVDAGGLPGMYIPDYRYLLVQLKDYSNAELMKKKDELSVVMMMDRLHGIEDFDKANREISPGYLEGIAAEAPEYLLDIIAQVAEAMLTRLNVPVEETEVFTRRIKERRMGKLFADFKGYDVQASRVVWKKEGSIQRLTGQVRKKMQKSMPIKSIAEALEEEVSVIAPIYGLLQAHPDWDDEQICDELMLQKQE